MASAALKESRNSNDRGRSLERGATVRLDGHSEKKIARLLCVGRASWTVDCFISGYSVARERSKN